MRLKNFLIFGTLLVVVIPSTVLGSSQAQWRLTAPMHEARSDFLSTLLPDGRVMVLGGANTSAEIFDPKSETWIYTRPLKVIPLGVIAYNGKVYTYSSTDVEEWSPVTGSWTIDYKIDDEAMHKRVLGLIPNPLSLVLKTSSNSDTGFSPQILDVKSGAVRDYKDIVFDEGSNGDTSVLFLHNQLHIVRVGQDGVEGYYYDIASDKWTVLPDLKLETDYFNDISYYVDGDDILYCLSGAAKHGWSSGKSFSIYSSKTGAVKPVDFDPDSKILNDIIPYLYLNGHLLGDLNGTFTDIDLQTGKTQKAPQLKFHRDNPEIVMLNDHRILVMGGGLISSANPDDPAADKPTNACEINDSKNL